MSNKTVPLVVKTVVVTELIGLVVALFLTVLSRNVDGARSLAGMFVDDPSFLVELGISFGIVSSLLSGFALAFLASRGFGKVDRRQ